MHVCTVVFTVALAAAACVAHHALVLLSDCRGGLTRENVASVSQSVPLDLSYARFHIMHGLWLLPRLCAAHVRMRRSAPELAPAACDRTVCRARSQSITQGVAHG
jgi:hypothetical protein